ncbi:aldo/keto reductase [Deinococcus sedimenti]|uniref:Aldo/keto reductase n=1 Tax=Deinococcus sedimenti TaxID=1867090 RepID=A0ABQ2SBP9_9DEIO|nr:aldo/keto reductase [Deinococcus sedimenti]GGS10630.1 aldo/keto reductase [Deinococcus sedimenti]
MTLTADRSLGRSGLIVSPFALGTMTFGTPRWGSSDEQAAAVFDQYVDAGGNWIDTADVYAAGRSEELTGQLIRERGLRDHVVLATKFSFSGQRGNPNASGNGRQNLHRALGGSLRRLGTDHIDLYWLHAWDGVTPAEEILSSLSALVHAGTIRYYGLSNVPAWLMTRVATLAQVHGLPGPVAVQLQYSLVDRTAELEHVPAARALGLGVVPWSPLAGGFLTGTYRQEDAGPAGQGRLSGANPFGDSKFTPHNWRVLDALRAVSADLGEPPARVALAWLRHQPGVTSPIVGARHTGQLTDHLVSLSVTLTPAHLDQLNEASTPGGAHGTWDVMKRAVFGGPSIQGWR